MARHDAFNGLVFTTFDHFNYIFEGLGYIYKFTGVQFKWQLTLFEEKNTPPRFVCPMTVKDKVKKLVTEVICCKSYPVSVVLYSSEPFLDNSVTFRDSSVAQLKRHRSSLQRPNTTGGTTNYIGKTSHNMLGKHHTCFLLIWFVYLCQLN